MDGRGQLSEQFEYVLYNYKVISGQTLIETSGAVKLHGVVFGRMNSAIVTMYDASISGRYLSGDSVCLGVAYGGNVTAPIAVPYDIRLNSGFVAVISGIVNGVVLYK